VANVSQFFWLALTALLHFTRIEQPVPGFLWTWLVLWLVYGLVNRGLLDSRPPSSFRWPGSRSSL